MDVLAYDIDDNTKKNFNKRANLALAAIGLNVTKGVQIYTRSEKTAKDAWDKLAARFEKKSLSAIINYRRRLYGIRAERNTDMHSHVNRIKTVAEHLEAIGDNVSEKDLAIVLLSSLPEDYAQLVTALETATEPDDLTWDMVRDRILKQIREDTNIEPTAVTTHCLWVKPTANDWSWCWSRNWSRIRSWRYTRYRSWSQSK